MESSPTKPQQQTWSPPKKVDELFCKTKEQKWSSNSATAGSREEKKLPKGDKPLQLYSMPTPNGQKVGIMLEELGIPYDAHYIDIHKEEQFSSGFVEISPNSKIPALVDKNGPNNEEVNVFESNSILLYLAEKQKRFLPQELNLKIETLNWLFWQASGQGPFTGQLCHFMLYAPKNATEIRNYGVARYGMEVQRLCSVLDQHLAKREFMVGDDYSIVDIAIFPWFQYLRKGFRHEDSGIEGVDFLSLDNYKHVNSWADRILERPAVIKGMKVCCRDMKESTEYKSTSNIKDKGGAYEAKGQSIGGLTGGYKLGEHQHKKDINVGGGEDRNECKDSDTSANKGYMGGQKSENIGQNFDVNQQQQSKSFGRNDKNLKVNIEVKDRDQDLNKKQQQGRSFGNDDKNWNLKNNNNNNNVGMSGETKGQNFGTSEGDMSSRTNMRDNDKFNIEDFSPNSDDKDRDQNLFSGADLTSNINNQQQQQQQQPQNRDNKDQNIFSGADLTSNMNRQQQQQPNHQKREKRFKAKKQSNINQQQPNLMNTDNNNQKDRMNDLLQPKQQQQRMVDSPHTKGSERKRINIGSGNNTNDTTNI